MGWPGPHDHIVLSTNARYGAYDSSAVEPKVSFKNGEIPQSVRLLAYVSVRDKSCDAVASPVGRIAQELFPSATLVMPGLKKQPLSIEPLLLKVVWVCSLRYPGGKIVEESRVRS